jgi:hypothetical protein
VSSSDTSLDVKLARLRLKLDACAAESLRSKRARTLWHLAHSSKEVSESSVPSSRSPRSVLSLVRYDSDRACISFISLTFTYSLTFPSAAHAGSSTTLG